MSNRKRRLNRCIEQDWKCYYCGCQMVEPLDGGTQPYNAATLEHIYSKNTITRLMGSPGKTVAACHRCNMRRGREDAHHGSSEVTVLRLVKLLDKHKENKDFVNGFNSCFRELALGGLIDVDGECFRKVGDFAKNLRT